MATIAKKIFINARPSKVFKFVVNPENWMKFVTSLTEVRGLSAAEIGEGSSFSWTYRMMGIPFHGRGYVSEFVHNKRFGLRMEGKFPINESYTFMSVEDGTELSIKIEYEMGSKIMNVIADKGLMEKLNRKESENVLAKIKLFCEGT